MEDGGGCDGTPLLGLQPGLLEGFSKLVNHFKGANLNFEFEKKNCKNYLRMYRMHLFPTISLHPARYMIAWPMTYIVASCESSEYPRDCLTAFPGHSCHYVFCDQEFQNPEIFSGNIFIRIRIHTFCVKPGPGFLFKLKKCKVEEFHPDPFLI
jgi:hypothetical protein